MGKAAETKPPVNQLMVSLRTLAWQFDADRSTVRRWLRDAGLKPVVVGRGRNASIRYRVEDIQKWLKARGRVD